MLLQPRHVRERTGLGSSRFDRHYSGNRYFLSLPAGTKMFQFPAFPPRSLAVTGLQPAGLPHSDMRGSIPVCGSPRLFAAYHVLLRRRKPRHPPFALLLFLVNLMKLQSLSRNSKISEFLDIRLSFLVFFTSLCLSILSMNCPFFSNGLQRYSLFRNLQ